MNKAYFKKLLFMLILCIAAVLLTSGLRCSSHILHNLNIDIDDNAFTNMDISCSYDELVNAADAINADKGQLMTICTCLYDGKISYDNLKKITRPLYVRISNYLNRTQADKFRQQKKIYNSILNDIRYFPVPRSDKRYEWVNYVNSWNNARTYKGNRTHEGTDIMGDINKDGVYPVISVSDGYISNIGWLELGGWRIGITSCNGIYYYYAHLDSYYRDFKPGDKVKAGDIIGYMGSTGYSKVEGTKNKFPTHLHFGIYIISDTKTEIAINPYNILKINENNALIYSY